MMVMKTVGVGIPARIAVEVITLLMMLIRLAIMKRQHQDCNSDDDSRNDGDVGKDEIGDDEDVAVLAVTEMATVAW